MHTGTLSVETSNNLSFKILTKDKTLTSSMKHGVRMFGAAKMIITLNGVEHFAINRLSHGNATVSYLNKKAKIERYGDATALKDYYMKFCEDHGLDYSENYFSQLEMFYYGGLTSVELATAFNDEYANLQRKLSTQNTMSGQAFLAILLSQGLLN